MFYDFFRFLFGGESFKSIDPRIEKTLYIFACTNSVMDPIVYGFFNLRKSQNTSSSRHQVSKNRKNYGFWYHIGVRPKVSLVFEDFKFKISEG